MGRDLKGIEKLLATHRKNMAEYVCGYDLFLTSIADRLKELGPGERQGQED